MAKITYQDIKIEGEHTISLLKLIGKQVKDIRGYLTGEFGDVVFQVTEIVFDDDSEVGVDGEHEIAYITTYAKWNQPNMDEFTLERLYGEDGENLGAEYDTIDEDDLEDDEE